MEIIFSHYLLQIDTIFDYWIFGKYFRSPCNEEKAENVFGERKTFNLLQDSSAINELVLCLYGLLSVYCEPLQRSQVHFKLLFSIALHNLKLFFLMNISVDRFFVVVRPTETHKWNVKVVKK